MSEFLLKFAVPFAIGFGISWFHRWDSRRIERKRNAPYRDFAAPVFAALHDPEVESVSILLRRSPDGRGWDGHRTITPKETP